MQIPRPEHPRPQFMRQNWLNLNGPWQFEIDNGRSGEARGLYKKDVPLKDTIIVPFCPESELSGINHKDFMYGVWYKRKVMLNALSGRIVLHFGAVDYYCKVYVNGIWAGEHKGGYVSFDFDITALLHEGANEITVYAEDDTRSRLIPSGKQSSRYHSYECFYTRTTGIWQTVWLEFIPESFIQNIKYYPNIANSTITIEADFCGCADFKCNIYFDKVAAGSYFAPQVSGKHIFTVQLTETHLWTIGQGNLYDVELSFGDDYVQSYFGLRQIRLDGHRFLINEKSVFQRLILDQGFYPEGVYTAPSDDDLIQDIQLSMNAGFNGARLHEKIFEERYLYHADRMGYIVWGEYPDWGLDHSYPDHIYAILPEWISQIQRDFNHPSIIGWCPHNETGDQNGRKQFDPGISMLYDVTKALDTTRPCIDASGNFHVKTDIFCVHDYNQDPISFKENYDQLMHDGILYDRFSDIQTYHGEATFVSEYGGIAWNADPNGWGYGQGPKSLDEFYE